MIARIYVLFGQFNIAGTLPQLAQRLAVFGKVTTHAWNDDNTIIADARTVLRANPKTKIILIGYSLGANETARIAASIPKVRLIVAYDPSRLSPLTTRIATEPVPATVEKALCYWNPYTWYYGGARLVGSPGQVTIKQINEFHLSVCSDEILHQMTFAWIQEAVR